MSVESVATLKLKFESDVKKGIDETSKSIHGLGKVSKDIGDILGNTLGGQANSFGKMAKGASGLVSAMGPVALIAIGVGAAFAGAAAVTKLFFEEALHHSPALAASFEQLQQRIAALTAWISAKLAPAFKYIIDLALKFLPDLTSEMGNNTEETRKNAKGISDWKDAHIKSLHEVAIWRATQHRNIKDDYSYQTKIRDIKYEDDVKALKNKQKQELVTLTQGTTDYNSAVNKHKDELTTLEYSHDTENLKAKQERDKSSKQKSLDLENQYSDSISDLWNNAHLRDLDQLENAESKELEQENLTEQQRTLIVKKYSNKRKLINKQESEFTINLWAQGISAIGGVFSGLEQIMANHTHKSKTLRMELRGLLIAQTVANTAAGIMNIWAGPDGRFPWLAAVETAALGVIGAGQVATISQQSFAKGGFPVGKNAQVTVNEEGQESILNARATRRLGRETIDSLNSGGEVGGNLTVHGPTVIIQGHADEKVLTKALKNASDDLLRSLETANQNIKRRRVSR